MHTHGMKLTVPVSRHKVSCTNKCNIAVRSTTRNKPPSRRATYGNNTTAIMAASLLRKFMRRSSITALASAQRCLIGQHAKDKVQICQVSNLLTAGNNVSYLVRTVTNTTSSITSEGLAATVRGGSDTTGKQEAGF